MSDIKKYAALVREMQRRAAKDPCWDGYEMAGTKKKNGKTVPNCVPKKKAGSDMKNIESKKADALNRFLSKYAKQPFDEFNKKADDNRALNLQRKVKLERNHDIARVGKSPENLGRQPKGKGVKMPKGKNLANTPDTFISASVTEALFNIYQEAEADFEGDTDPGNVQPPKLPSPKLPPQNKPRTYNDDMNPPTSPTYDERMSERMRQNPPKYDGDMVAHNDKLYLYNEWMRSQNPNGDKPKGPYDDKMRERMLQNPPKYNGDMVAHNDDLYLYNKWLRSQKPNGNTPNSEFSQNKPPTYNGNTPNSEFINRGLISKNSITNQLFNIYQEAYGVQVSPGSGGNFSMGPSIDTTSRGPSPGAGTEGANMENVQWKTKDKKIPKSKLQPGQDPVMPGKIKEAPRYTMMTPDQKVNHVKDDAGNLVTNKSNGAPKTTPGKYDRSPLTEDSLRQLYPELYENENKQKGPNKMRQFMDWVKGIHQQTFGGGQMSPDELAEMRVRQNPIQASQIQKFVKTAVADDNQFKTILAAMNEMGYSSGDILAAFD